MKICIDAGHGGKDPGAIDPIEREQDDGIYEDVLYTEESRVNLKAAIILREILKANNEILMTRENNEYIRFSARAKLANQAKANVFISLHANASLNKTVNGIETLYYPTSSQGKQLAQIVQDKLIKVSKANNREIKPRDNLYVLGKTDMPAILIEMGFITNPREEHLLNQREYLYLLMRAVAKGVEEYGRPGT